MALSELLILMNSNSIIGKVKFRFPLFKSLTNRCGRKLKGCSFRILGNSLRFRGRREHFKTGD
jgi:hypothetical protein